MKLNTQGRLRVIASALFITAAVAMSSSSAFAEEVVSLRTATENVLRSYGGEILKADEVVRDGQRAYRIRLIANGRVKEYFIDPHNGAEVSPYNPK